MAKTFRFVSYEFDEKESEIRLNYAFDEQIQMQEKIIFHNAKKEFFADEKKAISQIGFFLQVHTARL